MNKREDFFREKGIRKENEIDLFRERRDEK